MYNLNYKNYLKSQAWKEKRKLFLELCNYECELCGGKTKLQVHHKNYNNIFNEEKEDVIVLCRECHISTEIERGIDLINDEEYGEW